METITKDQAIQKILNIIDNSGPLRLMEKSHTPNLISDYLSFRWNWGWGIDANIHIRFMRNSDDPYYAAKITTSWSTTSYSPSRARTAACLHGQIADLACRTESFLDEVQIKVGED